MLALIFTLLVGSGLVYISKFNFMPVSVNLGMYIFTNIPLFYVIVTSLVVGLALSYILYLIDSITASFNLKRKDKEIRKLKEETLDLTKRVHQLELENEKIKNGTVIEVIDANAL
jgi:uncharacterized metal-binding protein